MLKQKELSALDVGEDINHFLILNKLEIKTSKTNKKFLDLELRDKSAVMPAKMWDGFEHIAYKLELGSLVKVKGKMDKYMEQYQVKIDNLRVAKESEGIRIEDLMPKSERDLSEMEKELTQRIKNISDENLNKLLQKMLSGDDYQKYIRVPAGKAWHHAYVHGLLEHTLEIVKICDLMCDIHPDLNRDLLIAGAILHDFGKTEELSTSASFDYTDKGRLIGHIVLAVTKIENACSDIQDFPEELKTQLIHLVLSHQGKLEHASPVEPKMVEAIALYHADELSAKTNAYKSAIKNERAGETNWTKFLPLAGTALYIPPEGKDDEFNETLFQ
jgi:3'-5' exoribonuclease